MRRIAKSLIALFLVLGSAVAQQGVVHRPENGTVPVYVWLGPPPTGACSGPRAVSSEGTLYCCVNNAWASCSSVTTTTPATPDSLGGVKGTGGSLTCPSGQLASGFDANGALTCGPIAPGAIDPSTVTLSSVTNTIVFWLNDIRTRLAALEAAISTYPQTVVDPAFSPAAGTYLSTQSVTISTTTAGATIYYTTDGTTPTTASTVYSAPVSISANTTLKALATKATLTNSAVVTGVYAIKVNTPTFSPGGGTYSSSQSVTISTATAGSTIYYTADGTTPTTASTVYSTAISVASSKTLKALATKAGLTDSAIGSSSYSITTISTASCASEPMRTTGTVFYYCDCAVTSPLAADPTCATYQGNDTTGSGTLAAPWRTGWKAKLRALLAGQTIALCRGGAFTADDTIVNNGNCTTSATCDVRDYVPTGVSAGWATDQGKRPIIDGLRVGYLAGSTLTAGMRFFNLQSINGSAQGAFMGGPKASDVDICNVRVSNAGMGIFLSPESPRWTVRQSQFYEFSAREAIFGSSTDGTIEDCYFDNTSYGRAQTENSYLAHPIYLSSQNSPPTPTYRFAVRNNEIHGCATTPAGGTSLIVGHGNFQMLQIVNNLIVCDNGPKDGSQWGIELDNNGYSVAAQSEIGYVNTIIRGNRISGNGGNGIWLSHGPNSIVENNIIEMPLGAQADAAGIVIGGYTARVGSTDPISTNVTVRNNTIILSTGIAGIVVKNEGDTHNIADNAIYYSGTVGTCFTFPLTGLSAYAMVESNACNGTRGTTIGAAPLSFTSTAFQNFAGKDYTPTAGSPLINMGTTKTDCTVAGLTSQPCYALTAPALATWSPSDTGRTRDAQPDIGALEAVSASFPTLVASQYNIATSNAVTVSIPANQTNDILLFHAGGNTVLNTPAAGTIDRTGWTQIVDYRSSNRPLQIWWKRSTGSEPASITFTGPSGDMNRSEGIVSVWRNCPLTGSPIGAIGAVLSADSINPSVFGITTTAANSAVIMAGISGGGTYLLGTISSGIPSTIAVNQNAAYLTTGTLAIAGPTGTVNFSWSDPPASHTVSAVQIEILRAP